MKKKKYYTPLVLFNSNWGGDGEEQGGGSGGTSDDPTMPDYFEWVEMYGSDLNGDGSIDTEDYGKWWIDNGFSEEDWEILNPGIPFPE